MDEEATNIRIETGDTATVTATAGTETAQVATGNRHGDPAGHRTRGKGMAGRADLEFVFDRLGQMPTLRSVLLTRMDDEYRNYRQAIERTLAAMADMLRFGLEPLEQRVAELESRLETISTAVADPVRSQESPRMALRRGGRAATYSDYRSRKERIKWGSEPDEIRSNLLAHLRRIVGNQDSQICIEVLRNQLPSALRWIYGKNAVFKGLDDLKRQYRQSKLGTSSGGASGTASARAAGAASNSAEACGEGCGQTRPSGAPATSAAPVAAGQVLTED